MQINWSMYLYRLFAADNKPGSSPVGFNDYFSDIL